MIDYKKIGQIIRKLRKERNLSQEQLAEKVWISTTQMSHIETGSTKLSLPVLVDLATALNVGTDVILSLTSAEKEQSQRSIQAVLDSCSVQQAKVLEQIIRSAKDAMDTNL